jgi:hypothetical protein
MSDLRYVCSICGLTFIDTDPDAALDEALETFTPAELNGAHIICDDCWLAVRERVPALDARYRLTDAYEQFIELRRTFRIDLIRELRAIAEQEIALTVDLLDLMTNAERVASTPVQWP